MCHRVNYCVDADAERHVKSYPSAAALSKKKAPALEIFSQAADFLLVEAEIEMTAHVKEWKLEQIRRCQVDVLYLEVNLDLSRFRCCEHEVLQRRRIGVPVTVMFYVANEEILVAVYILALILDLVSQH